MDNFTEIAHCIELHDVEGIRACFSKGIKPNDHFKQQPLITELISEYTRSHKFKDCVNAFIDFGLDMEDKYLQAVLSDDDKKLDQLLSKNQEKVKHQYSLRCAYTPLYEVSLMHICAEFNHTTCAKVLMKYGADINAVAGFDQHGFGGHTPIFHTVNQNNDQSKEMMDYLLSQQADLKITVKGLVWGKGYDWETLIPAVNPISYAMMGILPQMHRDEDTIANTVSVLLKHAYGIDYRSGNIPCKYLQL
jgi:hypothetical protein